MKIKFSKTLAVILAVASITAMTGITALADITNVVTTTTYDYAAEGDPTVQVVSSITADAGDADKDVTYLVADKNSGIKFIDQKTLEIDKVGNASTTFIFNAAQSALYDSELEVTAKFGTDIQDAAALPTFKFATGMDYFEKGVADARVIEVPGFEGEFEASDVVVWGQLIGNATKYGATIAYEEEEYELPAYGTIDGKFAVVIKGKGITKEMTGVFAE